MSVLKVDRSESYLEYYHTATLVRAEVTRLCMNENIVPKRWRPIFCFPTVQKLIDLMDAISAADVIECKNEDEYILKIKWQQRAIIVIEQIFQQLQYLIETLRPNLDKFQKATELLVDESKYLDKWKQETEKAFETFKLDAKNW